jgi:hypothetical protein
VLNAAVGANAIRRGFIGSGSLSLTLAALCLVLSWGFARLAQLLDAQIDQAQANAAAAKLSYEEFQRQIADGRVAFEVHGQSTDRVQ